MNAITLPETHKRIAELQTKGISKEHAEGIVELFDKAELKDQPATKTDIQAVRADIQSLRSETYRAMMIQTGVTVTVLTGIIALFFNV